MGNHENREFSGKGAQRFEQFYFRSDIELLDLHFRIHGSGMRSRMRSPARTGHETIAGMQRQFCADCDFAKPLTN
jgi:hypothetical protein